MRSLVLFVLLSLFALTSEAQQTCGPFSMSVSGTDTAVLTCSQVGTSTTWNFTVIASADDGNGTISCVVDVTTNPRSIGTATLVNTAGSGVELRVSIQGSTPGNDPVTVTTITNTGSNGPVRLNNLTASGNLNAMTVDSVGTASIGGDLTGDITVSNGDLGTLTVGGDVSADTDISVTNGSIGFINLPNSGSDFGLTGDPASIYASDQINDIFVYGRIWTSILVRDTPSSGSYGPVGRIESNNGIGSGGTENPPINGEPWNFSGFTATSTQGAEGLYCDGNFRSNLTIRGNLTEPISIGGALLANLAIDGAASAPIEVFGTLGLGSPVIYGSLTIGATGNSTPITSDITFWDSLVQGFVQINQPYAGEFAVSGSVHALTGGTDSGVEFYGGLSGTFLVASVTDTSISDLFATVTVGNATADAGAFASTGLIQIQDDMESGSNIVIKEACQGRVRVAGNLGGTVTTEAQFQSGSVIEIGRSLSSGGIIHCKAASNPLAGQVIINSVVPGTPGTWTGLVKYGTAGGGAGTTISHTLGVYTAASSTWGGGAVGLAGFKLYGSECDPVPTSYIGDTGDSDVKVALFGPVTWDSGFPFIVEWFNGSTWG